LKKFTAEQKQQIVSEKTVDCFYAKVKYTD